MTRILMSSLFCLIVVGCGGGLSSSVRPMRFTHRVVSPTDYRNPEYEGGVPSGFNSADPESEAVGAPGLDASDPAGYSTGDSGERKSWRERHLNLSLNLLSVFYDVRYIQNWRNDGTNTNE